tara:strand:- start:1537 stop:2388 length:852 start_codon:yes stop_codon:yes gene_type:complete
MALWDDDRPVKPPPRPPPKPPEEPPDLPINDPGLEPNPEPPTYIPPEPEPEPEPEPVQIGVVGLTEQELQAKYQTYGGAGANCHSRSTNWNEMDSVPYWMEGSVSGTMNNSTLSLQSDGLSQDAWAMALTDSVFGVVAPDSYIELSVSYTASNARRWQQPYSQSFSVCLEGGDSISASLSGGAVNDFSIVKNGVECINYSEIADYNTIWQTFDITITIDRAVHCSGPTPEEVQDDDSTLDDGDVGGGTFAWSQSDSWVLLGVIVLFLLGGYVLNTVKGGGECE